MIRKASKRCPKALTFRKAYILICQRENINLSRRKKDQDILMEEDIRKLLEENTNGGTFVTEGQGDNLPSKGK